MPNKIKYNGAVIASFENGKTATISCAGKKMEDDVVVTSESESSINIAFGDNPPEDASKLWIKSDEPEAIRITPEQISPGVFDYIQDHILPLPVKNYASARVGDTIYIIGGKSVIGNTIDMYKYNIYTGKINYIPFQSYNSKYTECIQSSACAVSVGTKIYIAGGGTSYPSSYVYVYDTKIDKCIHRVKMYKSLYSIEGVSVGTKIYFFGGRDFTDSRVDAIQVFDTETNTIETLSVTLPTATTGMGCITIGTKIYLFGGYDTEYLDTINVFDTETNTIETLTTTLPTGANNIGCIARGTKIYTIGGYNGSNLTTINVFDTETNTIETLSTTLPSAKSFNRSVDTELGIYGFDLGGIYRYNMDTNIIDTPQPTIMLPAKQRYGIRTAVVNDKVYLLGGASGNKEYSNTISIFDPENNTIETLPVALPTAASSSGHSCIIVETVGTKIYMFGCHNGSTYEDTIRVLDTETNTIEILPVTLQRSIRSTIFSTVVGNKVYIFGGYNGNTHEKAIQVFDTETNTIEILPVTLPDDLFNRYASDYYGTVFAVKDDNVYMGSTGTVWYTFNVTNNTFTRFDPKVTSVEVLYFERSDGMSVVKPICIDDKFYVIGNLGIFGLESTTNRSENIRVCNLTTNHMTFIDCRLPYSNIFEMATAVTKYGIYVFGGFIKYDDSSPYTRPTCEFPIIAKFVPPTDLIKNNIEIQQARPINKFDLNISNSVTVEIGLENMYMGNGANVAQSLTAYLHDGNEWKLI